MSPFPAFETLTVNGRHVILAREAARRTGWTSNYIGMLCRAGEIAGVRLSAGWLVDQLSLDQFIAERTRRKQEQHQKLRELRRSEYVRSQVSASPA